MGTAEFGIEGPGHRGAADDPRPVGPERRWAARMARRTFVVVDITEIYVHWYAGRSKGALAASLGVDRKTVRKYLSPAEASGITPGGPP